MVVSRSQGPRTDVLQGRHVEPRGRLRRARQEPGEKHFGVFCPPFLCDVTVRVVVVSLSVLTRSSPHVLLHPSGTSCAHKLAVKGLKVTNELLQWQNASQQSARLDSSRTPRLPQATFYTQAVKR